MNPEPTQEEIDRAVTFVRHVQNHLDTMIEFSVHAEVMCKICDKTLSQIYEEERA